MKLKIPHYTKSNGTASEVKEDLSVIEITVNIIEDKLKRVEANAQILKNDLVKLSTLNNEKFSSINNTLKYQNTLNNNISVELRELKASIANLKVCTCPKKSFWTKIKHFFTNLFN